MGEEFRRIHFGLDQQAPIEVGGDWSLFCLTGVMCHFEWKYRKWGNKGEIVANLACEMKWGWKSAQEGGFDTYGEKWKEGKAWKSS